MRLRDLGLAFWLKAAGFGLVAAVVSLFAFRDIPDGSPGSAWFYVALAVAWGALAIVLSAASELGRLRRESLFADLARRHGWTHHARMKDGLFSVASGCLPFTRGRDAVATNALEGRKDGVGFLLMDARYTTGSGKSRQAHPVAALALQMPFDFALAIEAERLGHKLVDAFGGEDIDVESDEFSRRFWVKSPDRRMAYGILHARAIEFLLAIGEGWTWHWNGTTLVMSRPGSLEPGDCLATLEQGLAFRRLLPRHLLPANAPRPAPAPPRRS